MNQRVLIYLVLLSGLRTFSAQFIVSTNGTDEFNSIGVTSNGVVRITGQRDAYQGAFWDWSGGGFTYTPVASLLPGGICAAYPISRDGRFIAGESESPNTSVGFEATVWDVSSPNTPRGLGFLGGNLKASTGSGIGIQAGAPIVAGFTTSASGTTAFIWTEAEGMTALPRTGLPAVTTAAYDLSADGEVWVVNEDPSGVPTFRAVVGDSSGVRVLDAQTNVFSAAFNISADATVIVGRIGTQAVFWSGTNYAPTLITLDGEPLRGEATASDGGWVVGSRNSFGWIASVTNGIALTASNWMAQRYCLIVTNHITDVRDIFVADGRLLMIMNTTTGPALFTTDEPLPGPKLLIASLPPGQVELRWPTNQLCTLESTANLTAPHVWTALTNPAPQLSNGLFTLMLPATNAAKFFRLNCPQ